MSVKAKSDAPAIKNSATAPVVFFDDAPLLGYYAGNVEVELTARVLAPRSDGNVGADRVCVGHLRCSTQAAMSLIQALTKAMQIAQPGAAEDQPLNS